MTLGQRIGALRKERGLSQEALGELVGVSRQAVSKWEADRAVPDVNNCVAMSKALGVSLNRLLDLEEETAPELTEDQLRLVERLTEQYAAAQKRLRRRWRWPAILLCCALAVGAAWLWEWLGHMDRTIDYLSGELAGLRGEIVSGVGDRVQESLEAESSLITDCTIDVASADAIENTVTYAVTVNLKTGTAETQMFLMSRTGGETVTAPMTRGEGLAFSGELACSALDGTPLYLVVEEAGRSRSQLLDTMYRQSDYAILLEGGVRWAALSQSGLTDGAVEPVELYAFAGPGTGLPDGLRPERLEVVIFRNDVPLRSTALDLSPGYTGGSGEWNWSAELDLPVSVPEATEGDTLTFALLAEDNYGRRTSRVLSRYQVLADGGLESLAHERLELDDGTYGTEVWP